MKTQLFLDSFTNSKGSTGTFRHQKISLKWSTNSIDEKKITISMTSDVRLSNNELDHLEMFLKAKKESSTLFSMCTSFCSSMRFSPIKVDLRARALRLENGTQIEFNITYNNPIQVTKPYDFYIDTKEFAFVWVVDVTFKDKWDALKFTHGQRILRNKFLNHERTNIVAKVDGKPGQELIAIGSACRYSLLIDYANAAGCQSILGSCGMGKTPIRTQLAFKKVDKQ
eukprot:807925_1